MISRMFRAFLSLGLLAGLVFAGCNKPTNPIEQVSAPIFNPAGGTYENMIEVGITTATLGTTILYTTDGSTPSSNSSVYSEPILIYSTTTLKAKAFRSGLKDSATANATYTFTNPLPESFVFVAGGTFNNGSSDVTISGFFIDKYELTQADFEAVIGANPSYFNGVSNCPVEQVSWFNAVEYCNRRSLQEGLMPCYSYGNYGMSPDNWPTGWSGDYNNYTNVDCNWTANGYRLPTEMEWMFAARGGNHTHNYTYSGSNDLNAVGWYDLNSGYNSHTVGTKAANELGIFDMSGNVYELVWDTYGDYPSDSQNNPTGASSGFIRVIRGGSWYGGADTCTVSERALVYTTDSSMLTGFRICRISP